jgi:hypothetical protein
MSLDGLLIAPVAKDGLKRVYHADTGKTLVILQVFREHLETA